MMILLYICTYTYTYTHIHIYIYTYHHFPWGATTRWLLKCRRAHGGPADGGEISLGAAQAARSADGAAFLGAERSPSSVESWWGQDILYVKPRMMINELMMLSIF
jgi:hypothetical protein